MVEKCSVNPNVVNYNHKKPIHLTTDISVSEVSKYYGLKNIVLKRLSRWEYKYKKTRITEKEGISS